MPLIAEDERQVLGPQGRLPARPDEPLAPDFFSETVPAAARLDNTLGSLISDEEPPVDRGVFGQPVIVESFDPFAGLEGTKYELHAPRFALANSAQEVQRIKAQIDREEQDRQTIDAAGGLGIVASLGAAILDPINLIPVGGQAAATVRAGGSLLRVAGTSARAGFLSSTAAEAVLQASQVTRTAEESAFNIAGGTVLSGLLGPAVVLVARGGKAAFQRLARRVEQDLEVPPAAEADITEPGFVRVSEEELLRDVGVEAVVEGFEPDAPALRARFVDVIRVGADTARRRTPAGQEGAQAPEAPGGQPEGQTPASGAPRPAQSPPPLDPRAVARARAFVEDRRNPVTAEALAEATGLSAEEAGRALARLVQEGRLRTIKDGKLQRTPRLGPLDALQFLAANGGIREEGGELAARDAQRFVPGFGNLVRRDGLSLDEAGLRLFDGGFFRERPDVNQVLELVEEALAGRKIFSELDRAEVEARQAQARAEGEAAREAELLEEVTAVAEEMELRVTPEELAAAAELRAVQGLDPDEALAEVIERQALQLEEELSDVDTAATAQAGEDAPDEGREAGDAAAASAGGGAPGRQPGEAGGPAGPEGPGDRGPGLDSETTPQGEQTLLPGVAPVGDRARAEAGLAAPLRGGDAPPPEGGLFDQDAGAQAELTDFLSTPPPEGEGSTVGAAAIGSTVAEDQLKSALGLEKAIAFSDPLLRAATSPSAATRRIMQELAEQPLRTEGNALGVASPVAVETRIKMWNAPLAEALTDMDESFVRYRLGRAKRIGDIAALGLQDLAGRASRERRLTYKEFKVAVGRAMRRGDEHAIPEVAEAARNFRAKLFDPLKERAVEVGFFEADPEVATAQSYLTRLYDHERLAARRPEFIEITGGWLAARRASAEADLARIRAAGDAAAPEDLARVGQLEREAGRDDAELQDLASQIADRILSTPAGRLPYDVTVTSPRDLQLGPGRQAFASPLKGRAFLIDDLLIEEFLESDVEVIARIYTRSMAPDVELARAFGSVDLAVQIDDIRRDYAVKSQAAADETQRGRLQKRRDADIRDVAAVRDRLRHVFALPENPNGLGHRVERVILSLNYLRLLGGMTISAIPDIARPVMVHGIARTFGDGLIPMVRNFKGTRLAGREVELAGTALDMTLDSRTMAIADVFDDYGRFSVVERGIQAATNNFGLVSIMAPWNREMKRFAGLVTMSRILDAAEGVRAGNVAAKDLEALAAGGIDREMAGRIAEAFARHGKSDRGVKVANTEAWADRQAVEAFRAAVVKEVDKIIVTPGQDRPLWISRPLLRVIGQFRSFSLAASQRILLSGLQQRDMATLNGALLSVGLGMMVYWIKQKQAGRPVSDDPEVWLAEGLDRSGLTGWFYDVNNIAEKLTRGRVGVSALTGGPTISRYASRNVLGAMIGPTAGAIQDLAQVTGSGFAGDFRQSDVRALRRLLPYQNLFYMRQLLDAAERGVSTELGVPQ